MSMAKQWMYHFNVKLPGNFIFYIKYQGYDEIIMANVKGLMLKMVLDISYLISCSVAIVLCSAGSGCSVANMATFSEGVIFAPSFSQVNVGGGSPRTLIWKVIILFSLTILDPPLPLSMDGDRFLYLHK